MAMHVILSTTLRDHVPDYRPAEGLFVDCAPPISAGELARRVGLPLQDIKIVMVNGRRSGLDAPLADGDRVGFFPAVGGG